MLPFDSNRTVLKPSFFQARDALEVAQYLIGSFLITNFEGERTEGLITETEAYCAPQDKASHAWNNRRTNRTEVMFGEGGKAYVYLCYGIHHLFNVVCGKQDQPHAVLIRAVMPVAGVEYMMVRRKMNALEKRLTSGPGVMSQAMGITLRSNNKLLSCENGIWIESPDKAVPTSDVGTSRRIGVDYAGEWAIKPYRFYHRQSPWVSGKLK